MNPKVYLETTIVSYLTAWPSRDLIIAAHQQITNEWWRKRRKDYQLFVSQIVVQECSAGDPQAVSRRLELMREIPRVELNERIANLAKDLMRHASLPKKANLDALHIAIAVHGGMDYLLTWNCAHIANAHFRHRVEAHCRRKGFSPPVICTPEELLEEA